MCHVTIHQTAWYARDARVIQIAICRVNVDDIGLCNLK